MIQANELRIGNTYHLKRGKGWTEIIIDEEILGKIFSDNKEFALNDFEPIPLTEGWLVKFGFEIRESSTCKQYYIGHNEITHDWLFDLIWLERPELINSPNAPFYKNGRHTIYYVHQLQNLYFALTGEELVANF